MRSSHAQAQMIVFAHLLHCFFTRNTVVSEGNQVGLFREKPGIIFGSLGAPRHHLSTLLVSCSRFVAALALLCTM